MSKLGMRVVTATVAVSLLLAAHVSAVQVTVDDSVTYQTMTGFGTCIPGWISWIGRDPLTHQAYWRDLGCSLFRVAMDPAALNASVCDETVTYLGSNIDQNIALFNFNLNSKGAPCPFGPMAAAANTLAIDDFAIVGAIWSPPDYMKTSTTCKNNESCGGHLIQTPENLTQFGRYAAAFIKGWSQYWGVPMTYFSPQNEPGVGTNRYSSCAYSTQSGGGVAELPPAIHAARLELDANGIACDIISPDGPFYISCWDHIQDFFYYVDDLRMYSLGDLHGYASHMNYWWGARQSWDVIWDGGTDPQHTERTYTGIKNDGVPHNWMTEISGEQCSWSGALEVADNIYSAVGRGHCDAFIYWLLTMGGDNSQALCSWVDGVGPDTSAPKYCAFKHYSRYVRPGAVRIGVTPGEYEGGSTGSGLCITAFKHPQKNTLTIVINNFNSSAYTADITLNTSLNLSALDAWRSSSSERWASVGPYEVVGGIVSVPVPAQSLVTLVGPATPNAAPVAQNDAYTVPLNTTLNVSAPGVLANDTDPNSDPLSAVKVSDPSHGSVTLNGNGSFSYTPTAGYTGADSFTYKAYDGALYSNVATVNITVTGAVVMHVDSIAVTIVTQSGGRAYARAQVVIKDAGGAPVSGATVTGTFTGNAGLNESKSATTDAAGLATLTSSTKKGLTTATFCVTNVTKTGATYNPGANVETCDSN